MRAVPRLALALIALLGFGVAEGASAAQPLSPTRIVDLRVAGGPGWHADNSFRLDWSVEAPAGAPALTAVHYRVRRLDGREVLQGRTGPGTHRPEAIHLPEDGVFVAEAWGEDATGLLTAPASTSLRLDRTRPGPTRPLLPAGWIPGSAATHLRLARPEGATPISGLRGYAISIDTDPGGSPCAGTDRCGDEETDLRAGAAGDSLVLPSLPEGTIYVHAVAVSGSGMRSGQVGTVAARVDATLPKVAITGAPAGWASGPVRLQATAADSLSGMAASGPGGPFTALAVDGGLPAVGLGASVATVVSGNGVHRVLAYGRDAAGNVNPGAGTGDPPATATVRIDSEPPRVAFAGRRGPAGPELLEAIVSDDLSGASARRGSIAARPARSRQRFVPLPTTVSGERLVARWDADAHPPGTYEFQATAFDVAGNSATSVLRGDGTRMLLMRTEKARTSLRAGFGRRQATVAAAPFGRAIALAGRLTTANGIPLAGEQVTATEAFAPGAAPAQRSTAVRTTADGKFSLRLAPGPSRTVELFFAGTRAHAASASSPLRLEARGGVEMRASSESARVGGRPVVFSGRIAHAGASLPAGGLPVALQFRLPGLPWSEFRTVASDRCGRFRYRYAFADDDSRGVRFQFRAVVAAQAGWPYATGSSKPIAVTGR